VSYEGGGSRRPIYAYYLLWITLDIGHDSSLSNIARLESNRMKRGQLVEEITRYGVAFSTALTLF
jgi:hypothetical protein